MSPTPAFRSDSWTLGRLGSQSSKAGHCGGRTPARALPFTSPAGLRTCPAVRHLRTEALANLSLNEARKDT